MKNAVYLDFGLKDPALGTRKIVKGEGYGILLDVLFREGVTEKDILLFMFGTALDEALFGCDWLLEALQLIQCSEAILFRLTVRGWTAVQYRNILTKGPTRTEHENANDLYADLIGEGELPATEPTEFSLSKIVSENKNPSALRGLRRWAFGR